jgi:hypothetical protein
MVSQNKKYCEEDRNRVREILLREWDPIGINEICPADEYDTYADKAYVMLLRDDATAHVIAAYLLAVATERMGLPNHPHLMHDAQRVAGILANLKPEFR